MNPQSFKNKIILEGGKQFDIYFSQYRPHSKTNHADRFSLKPIIVKYSELRDRLFHKNDSL